MAQTCVFFHAHPDDEALLTAGTMAMLAARGHRVVLVFATDGAQGLAAGIGPGEELAALRAAEARASAAVLGCDRVEFLGYGDSGMAGASVANPRRPFATADTDEAAGRLAAILERDQATLLTCYDPRGGYGHPDHVQVHRVGYRAASIARTPIVLEATIDNTRLARAGAVLDAVSASPLRHLPGLPPIPPGQFDGAYTPRSSITHRVDVRRWLPAKRASLAAHASQAGGGDYCRTLAALLRLPAPLFRWAMGTEYYVERGLPPGAAYTDPLASIRRSDRAGLRSPTTTA